jgi:hypothetical protein
MATWLGPQRGHDCIASQHGASSLVWPRGELRLEWRMGIVRQLGLVRQLGFVWLVWQLGILRIVGR